ncbi:MAG: HNH endonuclease [candidate division Zixibacteria bacterium]|nr:HNH endonuclease [candidate division Zixibacteria bacterium]
MTEIPDQDRILRHGIERCFFCGTRFTKLNCSDDHVFPEIIGGWFTVDFVCKGCNNRFGRTFDNDLRKNGFVHGARRALGTGSDYLKGQKISWTSPTGHSGRMGVPRGHDEPTIITSKQGDGTLISDDRLFIIDMKKRLRESGWTQEEIEERFLKQVSKAPLGLYIPVSKSSGRIEGWYKLDGEHITIQYDDMTAPIRYALIAKIALELWSAFGFGSIAPFNRRELVEATLANDPSGLSVYTTPIKPESSVYDLPYQPFHYCAFGVFRGIATGLIGLFGFLKYAIALGRVETPEIGDWRSNFWVFPVIWGQDEKEYFVDIPPPNVMDLDFALMGGAASLYRHRHMEDSNAGATGAGEL